MGMAGDSTLDSATVVPSGPVWNERGSRQVPLHLKDTINQSQPAKNNAFFLAFVNGRFERFAQQSTPQGKHTYRPHRASTRTDRTGQAHVPTPSFRQASKLRTTVMSEPIQLSRSDWLTTQARRQQQLSISKTTGQSVPKSVEGAKNHTRRTKHEEQDTKNKRHEEKDIKKKTRRKRHKEQDTKNTIALHNPFQRT
jgi:hypothetical protein